MKHLKFEQTGHVGVLTFNKPASLNALDTDTLLELEEFLTDLPDEKLRVLILTGAGKAFIAGADIKEMKDMTPQHAKDFSDLGNAVMDTIENFPIPVIAAVNGFALGGGLELALSADYIYASSKAKFGLPEVTLGLIPGFGGTRRLTRRIGGAKAKEMVFTGKMIRAEEALNMGLINQIVEPDELMNAVHKAAEAILEVSPNAVMEAKELLNACPDYESQALLGIEINKFGLIFANAEAKEGMNAFIDKRSPNWRD